MRNTADHEHEPPSAYCHPDDMGSIVSSQHTLPIVIENVTVITMTEEKPLKNQRVLILDNKISKIVPAQGKAPHADLVIDGRGKYLLPGLSEMHYHYRNHDMSSDLKLLVANGITTVRNMAATADQDPIAIRDSLRTGKLMPLNYSTTGPYLQSRDLTTISDVRNVVRMHIEKGYDYLKIADNLPENIYLELLEQCKDAGIPVVGHAQRALPAGYSLRMKCIEHIEEFLYLSRTAGGQSFPGLQDQEISNFASTLRQSGIFIGTTLAGFEFITNCLDDRRFDSLQRSPLTKYLAKDQRDAFLSEKNDYRKLRHREFEGVPAPLLFDNYFAWMKKFASVLYKNNVQLLSGSDTYGMTTVGFSLHRELALLQLCGMRPYDILLTSTVNPARFTNSYALSGTVSPGKYADLLLLNADPLEDIRNTTKIAGVFVKGRWFDALALKKMLEEVEQAFR